MHPYQNMSNQFWLIRTISDYNRTVKRYTHIALPSFYNRLLLYNYISLSSFPYFIMLIYYYLFVPK